MPQRRPLKKRRLLVLSLLHNTSSPPSRKYGIVKIIDIVNLNVADSKYADIIPITKPVQRQHRMKVLPNTIGAVSGRLLHIGQVNIITL